MVTIDVRGFVRDSTFSKLGLGTIPRNDSQLESSSIVSLALFQYLFGVSVTCFEYKVYFILKASSWKGFTVGSIENESLSGVDCSKGG